MGVRSGKQNWQQILLNSNRYFKIHSFKKEIKVEVPYLANKSVRQQLLTQYKAPSNLAQEEPLSISKVVRRQSISLCLCRNNKTQKLFWLVSPMTQLSIAVKQWPLVYNKNKGDRVIKTKWLLSIKINSIQLPTHNKFKRVWIWTFRLQFLKMKV